MRTNLGKYRQTLLDSFLLTADEREWIELEIVTLEIEFENPYWYSGNNELHTQQQVGYLAHACDLNREDRLEVISLLVGFELHYEGEDFPGAVFDDQDFSGPSLKDVRITRWMMSRLIEYYLTGNGHELNRKLGYPSAKAERSAKRAERGAQKQAKANSAVPADH